MWLLALIIALLIGTVIWAALTDAPRLRPDERRDLDLRRRRNPHP